MRTGPAADLDVAVALTAGPLAWPDRSETITEWMAGASVVLGVTVVGVDSILAFFERTDLVDGVASVYPQWRPEGPVELLPARPAVDGSPAEATVDETDTYGVRLFGVPVRTSPSVDAPVVTTAYHGERLVAECWAEGDRVTNGFDNEDFDDQIAYESTLWFQVLIPGAGEAFIPDARFSRSAADGRLSLTEC